MLIQSEVPVWKAAINLLDSIGYEGKRKGSKTAPEHLVFYSLPLLDITVLKPTAVLRLGLDVAAALAGHFSAKLPPDAEFQEHDPASWDPIRDQRVRYHNGLLRAARILSGDDPFNWHCTSKGVLPVWVWLARDSGIPRDAVQIDVVRGREVLRDVKPTQYSLDQFKRSIDVIK